MKTRPKLLRPTPRERLSVTPKKLQRPRDSKTRPEPPQTAVPPAPD